jgi:hypothetical protein
MGWREDLVTAVLAAWLVGGLFVDGWAHNTRPLLETFFTPWHAVFYSGFAATAGWVGWSVLRRRREGAGWRSAVPAGYGLALAGLAVFLLSGMADMAWHLAFGIEQGIAALLSPSHLGLFLGGFLAVTAPLRSAWADPSGGRDAGLGRLLPAVLSATLAGVLVAFMFQYLHPLYENVVSLGHLDSLLRQFTSYQFGYASELSVIAGIAGFLVATVTLFGPLVFLARRWRLPAGAALLVLGVQVLLMQAVTGFADPGLAVLGLLGAVAVEALARLLRPGPDQGRTWRTRAFAFAAPAAFWGVYLAGIGLHDGGLGWTPELWGGALVWSGLTLLGLTATLLPPAGTAEPEG